MPAVAVSLPARLADFRVLVVPGLHGSGPEHWQSRWQRLYPAFERVEQVQWDVPELPVWSGRLQEVLRQPVRAGQRLPSSAQHQQRDTPANQQPTLIVAHSFGCLATVHGAATDAGNIVGALLVAPADPEKFKVAAQVRHRLPFPAIVIGSDNDPWMSVERAAHWAREWGADFINAGALGHINADTGLGDWLHGQSLLQQLVRDVAVAGAGRR